MPSRVSNTSSRIDISVMEDQYSNSRRHVTSPIPSTTGEGNSFHHNSSFSNSTTKCARSLQSPPPLIPNSNFSKRNSDPSLTTSSQDNRGSSFMMQFMNAAAAAALSAANHKAQSQQRRVEPYATPGASDNTNKYVIRRPSSSYSSLQNTSPSSTTSSTKSMGSTEVGKFSAVSCADTLNAISEIQRATSSIRPDVSTEGCRSKNHTSQDASKDAILKSGNSLPLPPGAVPVGTLPHPSLQDSRSQSLLGLFTQSFAKSLYRSNN